MINTVHNIWCDIAHSGQIYIGVHQCLEIAFDTIVLFITYSQDSIGGEGVDGGDSDI